MRILCVLILLLSIHLNVFCGGSRDYLNYNYNKYINGEISEIIEYRKFAGAERGSIHTQKTNYLGNGLITIDIYNESSSSYQTRYICYNELFNENIISDIKLNEFIELRYFYRAVSFEITYEENIIKIGAVYFAGNPAIEIMVLTFSPETKRLLSVALSGREIKYIYNDVGRLTKAVDVYDWGEVVAKEIYYDGQLRIIGRPFFIKLHIPNTHEIVIYDTNVLKYHVVLRPYVREAADTSTAEKEESNWYYVVFEFDENKNEIKQTSYLEKNNYHIKKDKILTYNITVIKSDEKTIGRK